MFRGLDERACQMTALRLDFLTPAQVLDLKRGNLNESHLQDQQGRKVTEVKNEVWKCGPVPHVATHCVQCVRRHLDRQRHFGDQLFASSACAKHLDLEASHSHESVNKQNR